MPNIVALSTIPASAPITAQLVIPPLAQVMVATTPQTIPKLDPN